MTKWRIYWHFSDVGYDDIEADTVEEACAKFKKISLTDLIDHNKNTAQLTRIAPAWQVTPGGKPE